MTRSTASVTADPPRASREDSGRAGGELRCDCGSLLARRIGDRIELKCRRCKRVLSIAVVIEGGRCSCDTR